MLKKTVALIVDGREPERRALTKILQENYVVVEFDNDDEALNYLYKNPRRQSVVLLSMDSDKVDALKFLKFMHEREWVYQTYRSGVPVIIMSSDFTPEEKIEKAYEYGATENFYWPFNAKVIQRRIKNVVEMVREERVYSKAMKEQLLEREQMRQNLLSIIHRSIDVYCEEKGCHALYLRVLTRVLLEAMLEKCPQYKLNKEEVEAICLASLLHDIGKITVPAHILNKPGRLTKEEFEVVKTHSEAGAQIIEETRIGGEDAFVQAAIDICRYHHERYDGTGYPYGLKGDEIPLSAQVVSLVDVFDALISDRAYKSACSVYEAKEIILSGGCGTFNPVLLETFSEQFDRLVESLNTSVGVVDEKIWIGEAADKYEMHRLREAYERFAFERSVNGYMLTDCDDMYVSYQASTATLSLSRDLAEFINFRDQVIVNPIKDVNFRETITEEVYGKIQTAYQETTREKPTIKTEEFQIEIGGVAKTFTCKLTSVWSNEREERIGFVGKIVAIGELEHQKYYISTVTGLYNRRYYDEKICNVSGYNGIAMIDVDDFRDVNSKFGHDVGDTVLKKVADVIVQALGRFECAARYGGDEFVIVCKKIDKDGFKKLLDKISADVRKLKLAELKGEGLTVSIGGYYGGGTVKDMLVEADKIMYLLKNSDGKGGVMTNVDNELAQEIAVANNEKWTKMNS